MLSSMGQDELAKTALSLGAVSFVVKPFKDIDILHALSKALNVE